MFGMPHHGSHSKRKRMLSLVYAKRTLQSSPSLLASTRILLEDRFIPYLQGLASAGEPVEMYDIFHAIAIDFISAYVFGLRHCSDYFRQPDMGRELFQGYQILKEYQFWPQEIPTFTEWATKWNLFGFVGPSGVQEAGAVIEELVLRMQDNAEMAIQAAKREEALIETEDQPNVYAQLRDSLLKDQASKKDKNCQAWMRHMTLAHLAIRQCPYCYQNGAYTSDEELKN
ncbi:hypothetical protein B0A55_13465 [Friedmanniomyces simplex]|uniref:Uncharacterized protein n=1 Tax=Friedmanniomyces simplex TaxID=329884 RepID=A0A4U0VTC9_9PEZI|nr:hypothetical protein B0A55_13465 [Friedmanniomyces simplex]